MTQNPASPFALRLNNMALAVGDLSRMVDWYCQALGLAVCEQGRFEGVGADFAMLEGEGFRLELVSRGGAVHRRVNMDPPPYHLDSLGWKALVLETGDLLAVSNHLDAHGAQFVWREAPLTPDRHSTMIRDPEGNLIHIFGPRIAG